LISRATLDRNKKITLTLGIFALHEAVGFRDFLFDEREIRALPLRTPQTIVVTLQKYCCNIAILQQCKNNIAILQQYCCNVTTTIFAVWVGPLLLHCSNIAILQQYCCNVTTTVCAVWVVSINNTARKNRSRRRKRTSGDAKDARYLNSSGAERRTNKACGDKYSTIPFGKLRQPTYGSAFARYFSSCRTLRPSRKRAHLMESKSARTREGNLDFASLGIARIARDAKTSLEISSCLVLPRNSRQDQDEVFN